jgi:general secretion pathway protein D
MTRKLRKFNFFLIFCEFLLAIVLLCLPIFSASAQDFSGAGSRVELTQIQITHEGIDATTLRLTIAPRANSARIDKTPDGGIDISLPMTSRGNGARLPAKRNGLIKGVSFTQTSDALTLHLTTNYSANAQSAMIDANTIDISITADRGVADATPSAIPAPAAVTDLLTQGYELVQLQYADVSEVVGLLTADGGVKSNDVFRPHEPGFGSTGVASQGLQGPAADMDSRDDSLAQFINTNIAIDRRLNAVLLRGSAGQIARLKAEIATFDQPVDSVILETELVETTISGARALGIDFSNANGAIAVGTLQTGQFNTTSSPGFVASVSLQAAIYAQVQHGNAKIISRPRISAQSGSSAKIITGSALPILTSIALSGVNGVSQQVQYVNVGVTLQIAPRVTQDGYVTSHVFCVVSSVSGTSQGYPTISQREAETSATVRDGETFVIGGLTQDSVSANDSRVPGLGSIPVLGQLFGTKQASHERTELYIVVTTHIVHHRTMTSASLSGPSTPAPGA